MYRIISKKELNRLNETCKNYKEIADEYEKGFNEGNYTIKSQADIIRNMDILIFQMSQCLDWPSMRPYFQQLMSDMENRRRAESNRITDIMREQLIEVYKGK